MKWIDLPPFWLLGAVFLVWMSPWRVPWGGAVFPGLVLLAFGILLVGAALWEFAKARTTAIPRQAPNALITSGVFRLSRNPIYLADVLFLVGVSLYWGKWLGLVLAPVFAWMLTARFIVGEEDRLRDAFQTEFESYCAKTRRWL